MRMTGGRSALGWMLQQRGAATLFLVAAHVAFMVANAVFPALQSILAFSSADVLGRLFLWELFSYVFAHTPSLWFAVEMLFFFWFGREVEQYLGSRVYLVVYALLVLAPSLAGVIVGLGGAPVVLVGSSLASLGVFVMFAFLYPSVELLFHIKCVWFALGLIFLHALQVIAVRDWSGLVVLAAMVLCAFECARRLGIRSANALVGRLVPAPRPSHRLPPRRPPGAVSKSSVMTMQRKAASRAQSAVEVEQPLDNVDAILDKISRSGISSLSQAERQRLENARRKLLEQETGGRAL